MKVIWDPTRPFRTFVDPKGKHLSLLGTRGSDEGIGRTFLPLGVLVTNPVGYFCDLELVEAYFHETALDVPQRYSTAQADVTTHFPGEDAELQYDPERGLALIRFGTLLPEQWVRLGTSEVLLGLRAEDLRAIFLGNVLVDPKGVLEEAWIDALDWEPSGSPLQSE